MSSQLPELRKDPRLGPLLKALRGRLGLSHKDVAAAVWGDEGKWNWYSKLENRPNAYPSDRDLDRILEVLGSRRDEAETKLGRRTWSDPVGGPPTAALSAPPHAPMWARAAGAQPQRPAAARSTDLRSRPPARAAALREPPPTPSAASPAASRPAPACGEEELRREGIRLLVEMAGDDLEQGVRQLRSLRARSTRD